MPSEKALHKLCKLLLFIIIVIMVCLTIVQKKLNIGHSQMKSEQLTNKLSDC